MADSAALLVDEILPYQPMRQLSPGMACSRAMQEQLPRVLSVPFPLRFLFASNPKVMTRVLAIVYRTIATHMVHKAGFTKPLTKTGAVTLIQRFGSALNLNIHFHMLFLDGVYTGGSSGHPTDQLLGSSITYRIAVGPHQGRKVFALQTLPDCGDDQFTARVGKVAGFSLQAGVAAGAHERDKLERLCRYIARPAVSTKRLSLTRNGQVRYELKTPYRNGTTHVIFEPLDFISRLVSLVPKPQVNLTRFHGVFAPNSKYRKLVIPARQGKRKKIQSAVATDQTPAEKRASMTWAQRLKRVFNIDIESCDKCSDDVRIIASIEDPRVIQKILAHLDNVATTVATGLLPQSRAPPGVGFLSEALNLAGPDRSVARHPSSR